MPEDVKTQNRRHFESVSGKITVQKKLSTKSHRRNLWNWENYQSESSNVPTEKIFTVIFVNRNKSRLQKSTKLKCTCCTRHQWFFFDKTLASIKNQLPRNKFSDEGQQIALSEMIFPEDTFFSITFTTLKPKETIRRRKTMMTIEIKRRRMTWIKLKWDDLDDLLKERWLGWLVEKSRKWISVPLKKRRKLKWFLCSIRKQK